MSLKQNVNMETDANNNTNTMHSDSTKIDDPKNIAVDSDNKTLPGPETPKLKVEEQKKAEGNKKFSHNPYLTMASRNYDNKNWRHFERSPYRTSTKSTKGKDKNQKSLPPQPKPKLGLCSKTVPDKTNHKPKITLHDSKNKSKEKLDMPNETKIDSKIPGNHTKPLNEQPHFNSKYLSNGTKHCPNVQLPQSTSQVPHPAGQFPRPVGQFSSPTGQFPRQVGQLPQSTGLFSCPPKIIKEKDKNKNVVEAVHPPLQLQSDTNSKFSTLETNQSPKIVINPDSKNKSKSVLESPDAAQLSSQIPGNQIEPQVQQPDLNSNLLSNRGAQHPPNLSGQFPLAAGQFPCVTSHFPQPFEQIPRPTGQFIRPPGQFPQPTGQFSRPPGYFPPPTRQFSYPSGQFPQPTYRFPQPTGHFPYSQFPYPSIQTLFSPRQSNPGQSNYRNNNFSNTSSQYYNNGQFLQGPRPRQFPHVLGHFQHVPRPNVHASAQYSYPPHQFPQPGNFPLPGRYPQPNINSPHIIEQCQQFAHQNNQFSYQPRPQPIGQIQQNLRMPRPHSLPQAEFAHPEKQFQQPIVRFLDSYNPFQNSPGQFVHLVSPYLHFHYNPTEQHLQPHLPIQVIPNGPMILVIDLTETTEAVPNEETVLCGEILEVKFDGFNSGIKDSQEETLLDQNDLNPSEHVNNFSDLPVPKHKGRLIPIRSEEVVHQQGTDNDCTNHNKAPVSVQCEETDKEITNREISPTTDSKNVESTVENMLSNQETDLNKQLSVTFIKVSTVDTKFLVINESQVPNVDSKLPDQNEQLQSHLDVELSSELETLSYNLSDLNEEMSTDLDETESLDLDLQETSDEEMSVTDPPFPKDEIQVTCKPPSLNNNVQLTCQSIHLPSYIREQLLPQPKGVLQTNSDVESDLKVEPPPGFDETPTRCFDEKFASLGTDTPSDIEEEAPLYTDLRKLLKLYEKGDERPNGQLPLYLR